MRRTRTHRASTRALAALGASIVVASALLAGGPANARIVRAPAAADSVPLLVTYVARVCDVYTDVMANKARNNIMESLRDLGPDTTYPKNGVVNPVSEAAGSPNCRPLPNWRLSMGTARVGRSPVTENLSTVTGLYAGTSIVTQPSVPLLDSIGEPTGTTIEGAVTVPLTQAQADRLSRGQQLWVQGGTPTAPLNGQQTRFGYAALRCAQDALNGDNVEYVSYPQATTHVFCYYYAVEPPPGVGTITVRKQLAPGTNGSGTFRFDGDISFGDTNGDGINDFVLSATAQAPGSQQFVRGSVDVDDPPWRFREVQATGWQPPTAPTCTSTLGSPIAVDPVTLEVSVRLVPNDVVVCTYVNSRIVTGPNTLSKQTTRGVGSFPFTIVRPPPDGTTNTTATTTAPDAPVLVSSTFGTVPGLYTVSETLPDPTEAGSWEVASAQCNGANVPVTSSGQVRTAQRVVAAGESVNCLVVNEFLPNGSISVRKTTTGGVGTFDYAIEEVLSDGLLSGTLFELEATTTEAGVPVVAAPVGPPPTGLPIAPSRRFLVQEILPPPDETGFWQVTDIDCGAIAEERSLQTSSIVVTLTLDDPSAECDFENEFVPVGDFVVSKQTSDDETLRPETAELVVTCTDGSEIPIEVPPGVTTGSSGEFLVFAPYVCTVTETRNGAAQGVRDEVSATLAIDGAPPTPIDVPATFDVAPAQSVEVVVADELSREPAPPDPGGGGSGSAALPPTGSDPMAALAAASALLLIGCLLSALGLRRRAGSRAHRAVR